MRITLLFGYFKYMEHEHELVVRRPSQFQTLQRLYILLITAQWNGLWWHNLLWEKLFLLVKLSAFCSVKNSSTFEYTACGWPSDVLIWPALYNLYWNCIMTCIHRVFWAIASCQSVEQWHRHELATMTDVTSLNEIALTYTVHHEDRFSFVRN